MITRLCLTNFQSWESLDLYLSPVVVLVGETNQGKSAILRALNAVLYNGLEGSAFIRKGAKLAAVEVHTDDGHVVRLEKGVGVNRYVVDGVLYDKIGRTVPDAVSAALGVHAVVFDDTTTVTLQFQGQMDAPFLLADQGVKATRLLGSVSQAATLYQAARVSSAQKKSAMAAQTAQATMVTDAEARLARYTHVAALEPLADALEALGQHQTTLWAQTERVAQVRETLDRVRGTLATTTARRALLAERVALRGAQVAAAEQASLVCQLAGAVAHAEGVQQGLAARRQQLQWRVTQGEALVRRYERLTEVARERGILTTYGATQARLTQCLAGRPAQEVRLTEATEALRLAQTLYTCPTCGKEK